MRRRLADRALARRWAAALLLVVLVPAAGCNGDGGDADADTDVDTDSDTDADSDVTLERGGFALSYDPQSLTLTLSRGDDTLLAFPADGLQLGRVDRVKDETSYDPYPLKVEDPLLPYTPPKGLTWLSVSEAIISTQTDSSFTLALGFEGDREAALQVELADAGRFALELLPAGGPQIDNQQGLAYFRLRPRADAAEGFYGLGAFLDQVNQRGKVRAMQHELDAEIESGYNEAHVPIPLLIGTRGWGLFVESRYTGVFDVATEDDTLVDAIFGTGLATTDGLTFHLFAAEHPLDITKHYYEVTGYPALPARWALGPLLWRDENDDQAEVVSDANIMRDLDLACSGIWVDRPYASCVNSFDFETGMFDDPQAMIDELHDLGYRFGLWHTPYVDSGEDDEDCAELRAEAETNGYFPPESGVATFNNWSPPIDFTNPDAYDWWQGLIERYAAMGVEGYKLDYAEDVVPGFVGARNVWLFHDGSDERTMHSLYKMLYHRVYAETLPAEGGFLLNRAGTYGDQVYTSVVWPGDLDATLTRHRETFINDAGETVTGVGGLPASVIYGLTLGPSGYPFYGSDTGGYRHSPPDKETFTRWFEQTALSSVMQIGTSSNNVAWEYDQNDFDDEMLGWYRIYTRLHLRLWAYEWTYAQRIAQTGRPITRPLGLQYPELGQHPDSIYTFGDDLLVAPVVDRDARDKQVVFPAGSEWIDWWDGSAHPGGASETVSAPLGVLPLYLRRGGIVPLLRPTIDTIAPTTDAARVDSYATSPGVLYPRVAASDTATSFVLFDGTELSQQSTASGVTLGARGGTDFVHGVLFEVVGFGASKPASVTDNSAALAEAADLNTLEAAEHGWYFSADNGGSVYVKVGSGDHQVEIAE